MDYRDNSDKSVFEAREKIIKRYGKEVIETVDQYPLFAGPQTMLRYAKIYELLRKALEIPGNIAEFGTWKGATAVFMAKILNEIEPHSVRKIIVFDNFSGLPEPSLRDGKYAESQIGNYLGDRDSLEFIINSYNLSHRIELVEGDANKTVPEYFEQNKTSIISLAYFDFDLYEPTVKAWHAIKDCLIKGSQLIFDEGLDSRYWLGECRVVKEIINDIEFKNKIIVTPNKLSRQPEIILSIN